MSEQRTSFKKLNAKYRDIEWMRHCECSTCFKALLREVEQCRTALADAIRSPLGVIPKSAEGMLTEQDILDAENRRTQWRWTDRQYKLRDQWFRACHRKRDAYITLPCEPVFTEDGGVILKTRTRFGLDDKNLERKFPNWKKLKVREMLAFYDAVIEWRSSDADKPDPAPELEVTE